MLTCTACLRRATTSINHDFQMNTPFRFKSTRLLTHKPSASNLYSSIRTHATVQSIQQGHHRRLLLKGLASKRPPAANTHRSRVVPVAQARDEQARLNNASLLANPNYEKELARKIGIEVQYLIDPLKLATATLAKLRDGKLVEALELVRASEKQPYKTEENGPDNGNDVSATKPKVDNVVSWNHIMDYLMENEDARTALKVYNEMKKRGHRPDAHTYTIILRGFGKNIRTPNAVKDAVTVYNSIFAPNSVVRPNTIHTNAIINVCARGGDMDSLWAVAGRLPEKGFGSPDMWTYTTIINAINNDAKKRATKLMATDGPDADTSTIIQQAIGDGRKMWIDIAARWRKGDIKMDEPLVCAMGRLLLLSTQRQDIEDLFKLIEQTMNIKIRNHASEAMQDEVLSVEQAHASTDQSLIKIDGTDRKEIYAVPGNNTLSMLVEAATIVKQIHTGKACWDLLTSDKHQFKVVPDTQNITAYLRLLRISRASKVALDLLRQEWPESVAEKLFTRGTFVIAMSTCVRDKNNPNVFETASRILDLMQDKANSVSHESSANHEKNSYRAGQSLELDPKVVTMYLNLAMAAPGGIDVGRPLGMNSQGVMDLERDPRWNNLLRAMKRLGPDLFNVRRLAKLKIAESEYNDLPKSQQVTVRKREGFVDVNRVAEKLEDLVGLLKAMISAYDKILGANFRLEEQKKPALEKGFLDDCMIQKKKLTALLAKVDEHVVGQTGRSGLREVYDPVKVKDEVDDGEKAEDVVTVLPFQRTPAQSRWTKDAWKLQQEQKTQQENRRLSRRQVQEKEKGRRDDRFQRMYPGPRGTEGRRSHRSGDRSRPGEAGSIQQGWGEGYNELAEKMGQRDTSGLVEL